MYICFLIGQSGIWPCFLKWSLNIILMVSDRQLLTLSVVCFCCPTLTLFILPSLGPLTSILQLIIMLLHVTKWADKCMHDFCTQQSEKMILDSGERVWKYYVQFLLIFFKNCPEIIFHYTSFVPHLQYWKMCFPWLCSVLNTRG